MKYYQNNFKFLKKIKQITIKNSIVIIDICVYSPSLLPQILLLQFPLSFHAWIKSFGCHTWLKHMRSNTRNMKAYSWSSFSAAVIEARFSIHASFASFLPFMGGHFYWNEINIKYSMCVMITNVMNEKFMIVIFKLFKSVICTIVTF